MALFTHVDYAIQIYVGGSMVDKDLRRVSSHCITVSSDQYQKYKYCGCTWIILSPRWKRIKEWLFYTVGYCQCIIRLDPISIMNKTEQVFNIYVY